ncbi:MAG TPA: 2-oxoacid:acceptor oxidoreductase subunit alpha, partial [Acidimicrobiales bacterium]
MATRSEQVPEQLDRVVIRFAGDSGDGMQLTGDRFTTSSALLGNDLATFPDFPAEIRAPAGTLAGVSAFQVHISDHDILTPGDAPNVLVAMNPAALRANVAALPKGATLIVNVDAFEDRSLTKAGYDANPLTDGSLGAFTVYEVPMTSITQEVCKEAGVKPRDAERSKNFFALGLVSWLYTRPIEPTIEWIAKRFAERPQVAEANTRAFRAGFDFGETAELFSSNYEVRAATFEKGEYIQVTGNQALAWGLIAAARLANLPLFLGSYPITPASDILHELSRRKEYGVRTFQAEDEIAGVGAALGAAFGGALGVTTTSGPGLDLKSEAIGLAINLELPLLVVDVQRGGPSTGLPTKTEQADLLHAMYGRHGEAPLPIIAAKTPSHCFEAAIEAARIAVKYRTPVILLSDGYLANGAEPWKLPDTDALEPIDPNFATEPNHVDDGGTAVFWPYVRDETTLARPWAPPGIPGLEHRIGGLEKADGSGNVSYDGVNHERMIHLRAAKVAGIVQDIPPLEVDDDGSD